MIGTVAEVSAIGDGRERLAVVVAAVADVVARGELRDVRATFERELARTGKLQSVRLQPGRMLPLHHASVARDGSELQVAVSGPAAAILSARPSPRAPVDEETRQLLEAAANVATLVLEVERGSTSSDRPGGVARRPAVGLVGGSAPMVELYERIERAARTKFAVLVEGESGVGKELVARQVHGLSRRARGPFVAVNCAALVETLFEAELFGIEERTATGVRGRRGKFEVADGGTLFLDEIADLSATSQAKLLRVLQDVTVERVGSHVAQKIDVRVIAATNRPLLGLVESGAFRSDLYYRLNCVEVRVPPLRARRADIPDLVRYFLSHHADGRDVHVAHDALEALLEYDWPGNVRELERAIQRAVALSESDCIELRDLPPRVTGCYREALHASLQAGDDMRTWQSRYARLVLRRCGNNKREACRTLGVSYHTLQAYLRRAPLPGTPPCLDRSDGA
jgi:transcriptional regulator with PAS, ATPase and Fis domain